MVTRTRLIVKQKVLLSSHDKKLLKIAVFGKIKGVSDEFLYTVLAFLNLQIWCACYAWGAVKRKSTIKDPNQEASPENHDSYEIDHDRLRQLALGCFEEVVEFKISTTWFGNVYLKKCWDGFGTTSNNSWLKARNWVCDTFFEEIDSESEQGKKLKMVLNEYANPETGEFEEKCILGLGVARVIQPKSQESAKSGRPAGITTAPARYERFNIAKALEVARLIYRILEDRYNKKHNYNPTESFYDQLPTHKCSLIRNVYNALSGNEDFEGNLLSEDYRDFVFQYPETLVERIPSTFIHAWKEGCTLVKEAWEAMQKWGKAIPSWRKHNPYQEAEVREWEFATVDF